jgi:galactose mutarotase-like enzyme
VDEKFDHWMVWRPEFDTSFVCVEPMNIRIGTFENAPDTLPVLAAGESVTFSSSVEIINNL